MHAAGPILTQGETVALVVLQEQGLALPAGMGAGHVLIPTAAGRAQQAVFADHQLQRALGEDLGLHRPGIQLLQLGQGQLRRQGDPADAVTVQKAAGGAVEHVESLAAVQGALPAQIAQEAELAQIVDAQGRGLLFQPGGHGTTESGLLPGQQDLGQPGDDPGAARLCHDPLRRGRRRVLKTAHVEIDIIIAPAQGLGQQLLAVYQHADPQPLVPGHGLFRLGFRRPQCRGEGRLIEGPVVPAAAGGQYLVHQLPPGLIQHRRRQQGRRINLALQVGQPVAGAAQSSQLTEGDITGRSRFVGPLHHVVGDADRSIAIVIGEADLQGLADAGFRLTVESFVRQTVIAELGFFHQGRVVGLEHPIPRPAGGGGEGHGLPRVRPLHGPSVQIDGLHGAAFPLAAEPDLHAVAPAQRQGQPQADPARLDLADAAQEQAAVVGPLIAHERGAGIAVPVAAAAIPVEDLHQLAHLVGVRSDLLPCFQLAQEAAVDAADRGHVLRLFHAAFDLPGGQTQPVQLRQVVVTEEILGGKQVLAFCFYRDFLAVFIHQPVGHAAGLGTAAPIAAAAAHHGRKQALAAEADAQRAVDEHFQRDGAFFLDGADIGEGQLPGQNGPAHAFRRQQTGSPGIADRHLGAGMDSQTGHGLPQGVQQADILHDDRVHAHSIKLGRIKQKRAQLPVAHQRVGGDVDFDPVEVGQTHGLAQFFHRKIVSKSPGGKAFSAQIYRVRSVGDGSLQRGEAARRSQ